MPLNLRNNAMAHEKGKHYVSGAPVFIGSSTAILHKHHIPVYRYYTGQKIGVNRTFNGGPFNMQYIYGHRINYKFTCAPFFKPTNQISCFI